MSGSAQPIILAAEFPSTMLPLRARLEASGYAFFSSGSPAAGLSPKLALLPFNIQLELEELRSLVKSVRDAQPGITVLGVNFGRLRFKIGEAYGAGIKCMYALPFEEELLINKFFEFAPPEADADTLSIEQLMRVNVLEIDRAPELPFNLYLYLPANRKVIHYYQSKSAIDEKRVRKFKENAHYSLYIRRTELNAYKRYCAAIVSDGGGAIGAAISEGEQRRQSGERLMNLMAGYFSDEELGEDDGQMALDNLKSVVEVLDTAGTPKELLGEINKIAARQLTHITHAQNVAAYCCLFGLTLNAGDPTTLKLGGLLHDLGLADLPSHLIGRDLDTLDEAAQAMYKLHPGNGKIMTEEREIKVPSGALDMILYHHERPDGSGYPYGKTSADIPLLAKVCAFADEFDKLTSVRPNTRQLSPVEAVRRIAGLDGQPALSLYEESVHRPLVDLLLKPRASAAPPMATQTTTTTNKAASALTVGALLKTTKFAVKHHAGLTRETPEYGALWAELEEHWQKSI